MPGATQRASREIDALVSDLYSLYYRTGREVRYVSPSGTERAYWPNRYLQALKRADAASPQAVIEFVARMVGRPASAEAGLHPLQVANRPDLTVEALVVNGGAPYHKLFDARTVSTARRRLAAFRVG